MSAHNYDLISQMCLNCSASQMGVMDGWYPPECESREATLRYFRAKQSEFAQQCASVNEKLQEHRRAALHGTDDLPDVPLSQRGFGI